MSDWNQLWNRRVRSFWKEALIYWSYAARSGLTALLILFFIGGSYFYIRFLQKLPPYFPYWRVAAPVLAAVVGFSPIRTFLKEADRIFLMPAEYALKGYFRRSLVYSFLNQAVLVFAALLLAWPLYIRCTGDQSMPFAAAAAVFLIAKAVFLFVRNHELRLVHRSHRIAFACFRWLGAIMFSFMIFIHQWGLSCATLFALISILWITFRRLPKHFIHWDELIKQERKQASGHYLFYSWFADVPDLPTPSKPRRLFAGAAQAIPFEQKNTFLYLTIKTWVHSDLFGIAVRIVIAAGILLMLFNNEIIQFTVYAVSMLMSGAALTALGQIHRHNVWLELYPVHNSIRGRAVASVAFAVLLGENMIIGMLLIVLSAYKIAAATAVLTGIAWSWYFSFVSLQRKVK